MAENDEEHYGARVPNDENYDSWNWLEIQGAILGVSGENAVLHAERNDSADPASMQRAAMIVAEQIRPTYLTIAKTLSEHVQMLTQGDLWKGDAADAFHDNAKMLWEGLDKQVEAFDGGPARSAPLDQVLWASGSDLQQAQFMLGQISSWYATEGQRLQAIDDDLGYKTKVVDGHTFVEIPEDSDIYPMINADMRTVLKQLSTRYYERQTQIVRPDMPRSSLPGNLGSNPNLNPNLTPPDVSQNPLPDRPPYEYDPADPNLNPNGALPDQGNPNPYNGGAGPQTFAGNGAGGSTTPVGQQGGSAMPFPGGNPAGRAQDPYQSPGGNATGGDTQPFPGAGANTLAARPLSFQPDGGGDGNTQPGGVAGGTNAGPPVAFPGTGARPTANGRPGGSTDPAGTRPAAAGFPGGTADPASNPAGTRPAAAGFPGGGTNPAGTRPAAAGFPGGGANPAGTRPAAAGFPGGGTNPAGTRPAVGGSPSTRPAVSGFPGGTNSGTSGGNPVTGGNTNDPARTPTRFDPANTTQPGLNDPVGGTAQPRPLARNDGGGAAQTNPPGTAVPVTPFPGGGLAAGATGTGLGGGRVPPGQFPGGQNGGGPGAGLGTGRGTGQSAGSPAGFPGGGVPATGGRGKDAQGTEGAGGSILPGLDDFDPTARPGLGDLDTDRPVGTGGVPPIAGGVGAGGTDSRPRQFTSQPTGPGVASTRPAGVGPAGFPGGQNAAGVGGAGSRAGQGAAGFPGAGGAPVGGGRGKDGAGADGAGKPLLPGLEDFDPQANPGLSGLDDDRPQGVGPIPPIAGGVGESAPDARPRQFPSQQPATGLGGGATPGSAGLGGASGSGAGGLTPGSSGVGGLPAGQPGPAARAANPAAFPGGQAGPDVGGRAGSGQAGSPAGFPGAGGAPVGGGRGKDGAGSDGAGKPLLPGLEDFDPQANPGLSGLDDERPQGVGPIPPIAAGVGGGAPDARPRQFPSQQSATGLGSGATSGSAGLGGAATPGSGGAVTPSTVGGLTPGSSGVGGLPARQPGPAARAANPAAFPGGQTGPGVAGRTGSGQAGSPAGFPGAGGAPVGGGRGKDGAGSDGAGKPLLPGLEDFDPQANPGLSGLDDERPQGVGPIPPIAAGVGGGAPDARPRQFPSQQPATGLGSGATSGSAGLGGAASPGSGGLGGGARGSAAGGVTPGSVGGLPSGRTGPGAGTTGPAAFPGVPAGPGVGGGRTGAGATGGAGGIPGAGGAPMGGGRGKDGQGTDAAGRPLMPGLDDFDLTTPEVPDGMLPPVAGPATGAGRDAATAGPRRFPGAEARTPEPATYNPSDPTPNPAGANGPDLNGPDLNGPGLNGPGLNGPGLNGLGPNGSEPNRSGANGFGLSDPGLSGPGANGSEPNRPGANGPGLSDPGLSGPGLSGAGSNGPGANGPGLTGPDLNGPGSSGPGLSEPGSNGAGPNGFPGGLGADGFDAAAGGRAPVSPWPGQTGQTDQTDQTDQTGQPDQPVPTPLPEAGASGMDDALQPGGYPGGLPVGGVLPPAAGPSNAGPAARTVPYPGADGLRPAGQGLPPTVQTPRPGAPGSQAPGAFPGAAGAPGTGGGRRDGEEGRSGPLLPNLDDFDPDRVHDPDGTEEPVARDATPGDGTPAQPVLLGYGGGARPRRERKPERSGPQLPGLHDFDSEEPEEAREKERTGDDRPEVVLSRALAAGIRPYPGLHGGPIGRLDPRMAIAPPGRDAQSRPEPVTAAAVADDRTEEDEQRRSWLTENDDVWSGGRDVAPAVLGRDNW